MNASTLCSIWEPKYANNNEKHYSSTTQALTVCVRRMAVLWEAHGVAALLKLESRSRVREKCMQTTRCLGDMRVRGFRILNYTLLSV